MNHPDVSRSVRPRALNDEDTIARDPGAPFTPGAFFMEAGAIIAVCLMLALIARILFG